MKVKKEGQRSAELTTADLHSKAFGGFKKNHKIKHTTCANLSLFQVKQTNKKVTKVTKLTKGNQKGVYYQL